MNPRHVRARNYKCIDDTGWVEVDTLTCLIGKNEAGKTVLMEAMEHLNPAHGDGAFTPYEDYPRRRWPEYKHRHEDEPDPVVSVRFELDEEERSRLEERGGRASGAEVVVTKDYANDLHWEFDIDEASYVDRLVSQYDIDGETDAGEAILAAQSIAELEAALDGRLEGEADDEADALAEAAPSSVSVAVDDLGNDVLRPELPTFHYVGEYTTLDAEIDLDAFIERREAGDATPSDSVFQSLLSVANLDIDVLRDADDWRETVTELEAASSEITNSVTQYWSQADDVEIHLRGHEDDGSRTIELRVENPHHGVTVEFDRRSRGFQWFFSTFCTVYDLRETSDDIVLLLDEPGLHLHPKAKREFLSFLDREIAAEDTLVYSTHSPFMIDLDRAHQTKMVSKGPVDGTTVLSDPAAADEYTRYPLQNVFELDVMETLVSRSQLLFVGDGTTYEYLYNVSALLEETDAAVLDRGWTVIPIGTLENTQTVRSVFDTAEGEVAVVHDGTETVGWDAPEDVTVVGIGTHARVGGTATIEDVLSEAFYLELVNRTYAAELSDASGAPDRIRSDALADYGRETPIVERLERYFADHGLAGGSFDRARPAAYLQRNRGDFAAEVDMDTRKAFGSLARALNKTLDSFDGDRGSSGGFLGSLFGR